MLKTFFTKTETGLNNIYFSVDSEIDFGMEITSDNIIIKRELQRFIFLGLKLTIDRYHDIEYNKYLLILLNNFFQVRTVLCFKLFSHSKYLFGSYKTHLESHFFYTSYF